MILLDTSVVIDCLTGPQRGAEELQILIDHREIVALSSLVIFEWLRGSRTKRELELQEMLFPTANALPFGSQEAEVAAHIYRSVQRPRGREIDIGIAATAIHHQAHLWTLNTADFTDIPGLSLWPPARAL